MNASLPVFKMPRSVLAVAIALNMTTTAQAGSTYNYAVGGTSFIAGISFDGTVIAGSYIPFKGGSPQTAFVWGGPGTPNSLGTLGGSVSSAVGISGDGRWVVGKAELNSNSCISSGRNGCNQAYIWSAETGMLNLGVVPGGQYSYATGVSYNGSLVVGNSDMADSGLIPLGGTVPNPVREQAFLWRSGDPFNAATATADYQSMLIPLGTLGGTQSSASDISSDGTAVIGWANLSNDSASHAFRWTQAGGMVDIGSNFTQNSEAQFVSRNGNGVTGLVYTTSLGHAFYWTAASNVMIDIGNFGGRDARGYSRPHAISGGENSNYGGFIVVGGAGSYFSDSRAFLYAPITGLMDLGTLDGLSSSYASAYSVTNGFGEVADEVLVVGVSDQIYGVNGAKAFVWNKLVGMKAVWEWAGVLNPNFESSMAAYVSNDGSTITGYGRKGQDDVLWIAREGVMVAPMAVAANALVAASSVVSAPDSLSSLVTSGSHHRPLALYANTSGSDTCMWVNGDVGQYGYGQDAKTGMGEVGVCGSAGDFTFGLGVGTLRQKQDFDYSGNMDVNGQFVTGEVNYKVPNAPVLLTALTMFASYDADIKLGYANGGGEAHSDGDTDMHSQYLRLRADWLNAATVSDVNFTPWASIAYNRTEIDNYSLTGDVQDFTYDDQNQDSQEARVGITATYPLSPVTTLSATLESVHMLDTNSEGGSIEATGLFVLDELPDANKDANKTWQRVGFEVDHQVSDMGLLSGSVYLANEGDDPNTLLAIKYIHRF